MWQLASAEQCCKEQASSCLQWAVARTESVSGTTCDFYRVHNMCSTVNSVTLSHDGVHTSSGRSARVPSRRHAAGHAAADR